MGPWRYGGKAAIEEDSGLVLPEEKRAKMGDKKMTFGQRRKVSQKELQWVVCTNALVMALRSASSMLTSVPRASF